MTDDGAALQARQKESLARSQSGSASPFGFGLIMFEHARDHLQLYRALLGSDGATISLGSIRQIIADLARTELSVIAPKATGQAETRELKVQFVVGAFMGVLTHWLDTGAVEPPADVDRLFRTMVIEGVPSPIT